MLLWHCAHAPEHTHMVTCARRFRKGRHAYAETCMHTKSHSQCFMIHMQKHTHMPPGTFKIVHTPTGAHTRTHKSKHVNGFMLLDLQQRSFLLVIIGDLQGWSETLFAVCGHPK